MQRWYQLLLLGLVLGTFAFGFGCKRKQPQSQLQAIDTILQESTIKDRKYNCGFHEGVPTELGALDKLYSRNVKIYPESKEALVRKYLVSVPSFLLDNLRQAGGAIMVEDDVQTKCAGIFNALLADANGYLNGLKPDQVSGRVKDLNGCWHAGKNEPPNIYVSSDPEQLNDSLLPLFAYLQLERYSEVYAQRAFKEGKKTKEEIEKVLQAVSVLDGVRLRIVKEAFEDLRKAKKTGVIERLQAEFDLPKDDTDITEDMVEALGNMILAESVDSFFCSTESYNYFSGNFEFKDDDVNFKNTFNYFKQYANQVFEEQPWHKL